MPKLIKLTKAFVKKYYVTKRYSAAKIATMVGCSAKTILVKIKLYGFKIRKARAAKDYSYKYLDLTGQRFGKLIVVKKLFFGSEENSAFPNLFGPDYSQWVVKCDCGITRLMDARRLLRKDGRASRSCGCTRKGKPFDLLPNSVFINFKSKAKNRNIEFKITREYAENLFKNQQSKCIYTGWDLEFGRRKESWLTTASLDRINSKIGYIEGNVQWVHKHVNMMKGTLTHDEFVIICKHVGRVAQEKDKKELEDLKQEKI